MAWALAPMAVLVVYWPLPGAEFVWLDRVEILGASRLALDWHGVVDVFRHDGGANAYYRPLVSLLHSFDHVVWGVEPRGFRFTNAVLHAVNAGLLGALIWRFGGSASLALWVCLLWSLHPVNTAVVGIVNARGDLLVAALMCLSLILVGRASAARRGYGYIGLALLSYGAALLSKELAIILPLAVWLADFSGLWRGLRARRFASWWAGVLIMAGLAVCGRLAADEAWQAEIGMPERLLTFATVYVQYVGVVLVPNRLFVGDTVVRFYALSPMEQVSQLAVFAMLVGGQVCAWVMWRASRPWILCWNLALLPVSQIVPISHFRADRYLYVPSIGLVGGMVVAVRAAFSVVSDGTRNRLRVAGSLLAAVLVASYVLRVGDRLRSLSSDEALFAAELRSVPEYREGMSVLAMALERRGELEKAGVLWQRALRRSDHLLSFIDLQAAIVNYSANMIARSKYREAYSLLYSAKGAIHDPVVASEARYNLAVSAAYLGKTREAQRLLRQYVAAHPDDAGAIRLLSAVTSGGSRPSH